MKFVGLRTAQGLLILCGLAAIAASDFFDGNVIRIVGWMVVLFGVVLEWVVEAVFILIHYRRSS